MRTPDGEILIGCFGTDTAPAGIYSATLDQGSIRDVRLRIETPKPSWILTDGDLVYVCNELSGTEDAGRLSTFRRDPVAGDLVLVGSTSTLGLAPCHLAFDPRRGALIVANYFGSVTIHPITTTGQADRAAQRLAFAGSGSHPARQQGSHPHMVAIDPVTGSILIPDLGGDVLRVLVWTAEGWLAVRDSVTARRGSGPRHLAFLGSDLLLVVGELDSSVGVFERRSDSFAEVAHGPASSAGRADNAPAAVAVVDDRTALVSNRGCDEISTVRVHRDEQTTVDVVHSEPSPGAGPRDVVFDRDSRLVFTANKEGNCVGAQPLGAAHPASPVAAPQPACFARALSGALAVL